MFSPCCFQRRRSLPSCTMRQTLRHARREIPPFATGIELRVLHAWLNLLRPPHLQSPARHRIVLVGCEHHLRAPHGGYHEKQTGWMCSYKFWQPKESAPHGGEHEKQTGWMCSCTFLQQRERELWFCILSRAVSVLLWIRRHRGRAPATTKRSRASTIVPVRGFAPWKAGGWSFLIIGVLLVPFEALLWTINHRPPPTIFAEKT